MGLLFRKSRQEVAYVAIVALPQVASAVCNSGVIIWATCNRRIGDGGFHSEKKRRPTANTSVVFRPAVKRRALSRWQQRVDDRASTRESEAGTCSHEDAAMSH
ncbi:hypothetical protein JOB18_047495 [Solea senegalensis]|uniref:Secreted protein n=1 Tax=Solea senegalensis TaxID=28829 RepID=A0AAV6PIJ6_SOLSE|nr:hypothetical protein JOB18_047495 [Solea senegalensis]